MDGMERKQFQLTREQAAAIRREATRRKLSDSAIVGKYTSGQEDLSRDHDRQLADDFRTDRLR
jgi:hypothetical protein